MVKLKKYLVSTQIKETWPENKNNHIIFSSIAPLQKFPDKDFPYKKFNINNKYWTPQRVAKDFIYIENLYEKTLLKLSSNLNDIHKTNYSKKFWRILIGPWLFNFIFFSFDRWKNITTTLNKFKIDKVKILNLNKNLLTPYESEDFIIVSGKDLWNQYIYQTICLDLLPRKKIDYINYNTKKQIETDISSLNQGTKKPNSIKLIIFNFFNFFKKNKYKYLIYRCYIGALKEIKLSLKLGQLPLLFIPKQKYKKNKNIDYNIRKKLNKLVKPKNKFENFISKIIQNQVPKVFLENFDDLKNFSSNSNLPQNPKKILTANALWHDSFFMYHTAKLAEKRSKIIYAQHGGAYGISKYSWPEKHEKKISDKYLTWGWKGSKSEKKIKSFFLLTKPIKYDWDKKKEKLLVLLRFRQRYIQSPETESCCDLYTEYLKYWSKVLTNLDENIKKNVVLRLKYKNLNPKSIDFFSNLEKNFTFDSSKSYYDSCMRSRLVITNTTNTTFLEAIASNVPVMCIINKSNIPFRKSAQGIFNLLEKKKIIFYNPEKAAKYINFLWKDNVKSWWFKKETQLALEEFKNKFAKPNKNIIGAISKEINKL